MRHSGLPLAIAGSHASTHILPEHRRAQNADHLAHNTPFSAFFTKVVCDLGATPPQVAASPSPIGGIALHEPPTRRQKASCSANPRDRRRGGHWRSRRARAAARRGPGCGTRGRRQGLAGLRGNTQPCKHRRCGGRRQDQRVAVPGCRARGRRQGLAGQRADAPSEARGADESRAGRRPRARQAARPGTTARGPLHPLRGATPVTGRCTRSEEVHCLRIGCSTPNHKNKRGICETRAWLRHPWGGGAWPGFETTRRAKLAARTARGRAAAHGRTKQHDPQPQLSTQRSADTPRRAVAAIRDGDAGGGQPVA